MTEIEWRKCPDDGKCHHLGCEDGGCFRVLACGPLSGVYPHNRWPVEVTDAERAKRDRAAS